MLRPGQREAQCAALAVQGSNNVLQQGRRASYQAVWCCVPRLQDLMLVVHMMLTGYSLQTTRQDKGRVTVVTLLSTRIPNQSLD